MFYILIKYDNFTTIMNKRKATVGVILPRIERWSSYYGGAVARFTYETLKRTHTSKYKTTIFGKSCKTEHAYGFDLEEPRLGFLFIYLDKWFSNIKIEFDGWFYIVSMYLRLKKKDVIYIHHRPHYALILRKLGYKGKIIIHLHGDFNLSTTEFVRRITNTSDIVISCSQKIADRLFVKYSTNLEKSRILYNGADETIFTYKDTAEREKQILFVGRIDEIKGVSNLLIAFEKISNEFPDWKLILAGSAKFGGGKELTSFEAQIKLLIEKINKTKQNVIHLGYVKHDQLNNVFHKSKIFCLPSIVHDAFPLVIIEAMFSGTPIVASNMGGIPEAVDKYAVLCEPNSNDLYLGLKELIMSEEKQELYSKNGRERAEKLFNWDKITEDQVKILEELF